MAKPATIQYRYLKRDGFPDIGSLKAALVRSMGFRRGAHLVGESIVNRQYDLDQDGRIALLNKITAQAHWDDPFFAGQLTLFERGANVPAILGDPNANVNELNLGQFALGDDASYIHGILYFVAIEDHIGLIESSSLRSGKLERYFTALLTQCNEIVAGQTVVLNTRFNAPDGRRVSNARQVEVKAKRSTRDDIGPGGVEVRIVDEDIARLDEQQSVIRVLQALDWSPDAIARLMNEVPPGGWLEGFVKFFIKNREARRKTISRQTLDEAFRNIDPADITLLGDTGTRERGGAMQISMSRPVDTEGSLLRPDSAVQQIEYALRQWSEEGLIDLVLP